MKKIFKNIKGKNVDLINLDFKFSNDFWEYSKDKRLYEFLDYPPFKNKSISNKYLKNLISKSKLSDSNWWFIYKKDIKKVIGSISTININYKKKYFEVGYALSPDYWGKGLFNESLNLLLKTFLIKFKFNKAFALTHSKNIRSIKSLISNNFKLDGLIRDHSLRVERKKFEDFLMLSILQKEYLESSKKINKKTLKNISQLLITRKTNYLKLSLK